MQPVVSPLMQALYSGQAAEAQRLTAEIGSGNLTIFEAAGMGDVTRLAALVAREPAAVNSWSPDGFQPLALAAFFGRRAAVELLLAHGAEINTHARHAFNVAPLHAALAGPDREIARPLIVAGADVNARQQGGITPLHEAAMNNESALVRLLLEHGADASARDDNGRSAADYARQAGHTEVVEALA